MKYVYFRSSTATYVLDTIIVPLQNLIMSNLKINSTIFKSQLNYIQVDKLDNKYNKQHKYMIQFHTLIRLHMYWLDQKRDHLSPPSILEQPLSMFYLSLSLGSRVLESRTVSFVLFLSLKKLEFRLVMIQKETFAGSFPHFNDCKLAIK